MSGEDIVNLIKNEIDVAENMELLYKKYYRFILSIVRKRINYLNDESDLMQEAYFGLYNAALVYDPNLNCQFIGTIKWHILTALRNSGQNSARLDYLIYRYKKIRNNYYFKFQCYPEDSYYYERLGIGKSILDIIKQCSKGMVSLNSKIAEDNDDEIESLLEDKTIDFDREIELEEMSLMLDKALSKLPNKNEYIIRQIYYKNRTEYDVANELKTTSQNINNLKYESFSRLRKDKEFIKSSEAYRNTIPIKHVGLNEFKRTNTSSVEWSVLRMDNQKKYNFFKEILT